MKSWTLCCSWLSCSSISTSHQPLVILDTHPVFHEGPSVQYMYFNEYFTCGWVCVGCVLWLWRQDDDGRVWRSFCEEGSRLGECKHSELVTLWHVVNSHFLHRNEPECFPNPYCLSCHSLGGYIKLIYSFLQAKNSTITKISQAEPLNVVSFQTLMSMFWLAWGQSRRGLRLPSLCRSEQFIENASRVCAWLKLLLTLELRDAKSNPKKH